MDVLRSRDVHLIEVILASLVHCSGWAVIAGIGDIQASAMSNLAEPVQYYPIVPDCLWRKSLAACMLQRSLQRTVL